MSGHLCRLDHAGDGKEQDGDTDRSAADSQLHELVQLQGVLGVPDPYDGDGERQSAGQVHHDLQESVLHGLRGL